MLDRSSAPPHGAAARPGKAGIIDHALASHYPALRAIPTLTELHRSALWHRIGGEVESLLDAVERVDAPGAAPLPRRFRALAWNVQRGTHLDELIASLKRDPELARADVLMLSEVDNGLGRSGNRHVARELAAALGMGYAFAVSYLTLEDDFEENASRTPNTLALAGSAILSRAPILRAANADVPALRDKFSSSEKRLGRKRAVVAELATEAGPVIVAQAHLDSTASSQQRAIQLAAILDAADALGGARTPLLLGGDLNTTTYQYSSTMRLVRDLLHKLFVTGFDATIDNYLTPERLYEQPLFDVLAARDLVIDGFNVRGEGTIRYDFNTTYAREKVRDAVGELATRLLVRRLRRRNGIVAAHLDWFAARGLAPRGAAIIRPRVAIDERGPSDHDPIVADVEIAAPSL